VLRRVKRLEDSGVIDRYVALVKPESRGPGAHRLCECAAGKAHRERQAQPDGRVPRQRDGLAEVVECAALTGEMDFQLRLVVADMAAYARFMMDTLLKHPSVQDCKTSFVMDRMKARRHAGVRLASPPAVGLEGARWSGVGGV
jgi:Lrp/AsnC family transcriptional regulator, leucine-responsive regulatory protein